mgnify:CR=1 FL=1
MLFRSEAVGLHAADADAAAQWKSRGNAALAAGDLAEAQACYAGAVREDGKDPLARLNLGFALLEAGAAAAAEACAMSPTTIELPEVSVLIARALVPSLPPTSVPMATPP